MLINIIAFICILFLTIMNELNNYLFNMNISRDSFFIAFILFMILRKDLENEI